MRAVQEARLAKAARSFQFDASLAPYNLSALHQWRTLSGHITRVLIEKVAPLNSGNLSVTTEADPFLKGPRTAAEERLAAQLQSKADLGLRDGMSAADSGPGSSGAPAAEQAGWGSQGGQPAASSGPESAAAHQAGKASSAGRPAGSSLPEQAAGHAPAMAGSTAAAPGTQLPAKQAQRGIGRCFYTAVPQQATVRRWFKSLLPPYMQIQSQSTSCGKSSLQGVVWCSWPAPASRHSLSSSRASTLLEYFNAQGQDIAGLQMKGLQACVHRQHLGRLVG